MAKSSVKLHEKFKTIERELGEIFHERTQPINGISLAILSGTNTLFLGSPGIAKSALVNNYAKHITGGKYFWWLINRFSTPEELFGPHSMEGLKNDSFRRVIEGTLADCHIGFIDEIFKANSGVLNTLLPVLNERVFFNDRKPVELDLLTVFGASNEIPDAEDNLDALYDRFPLKYKIIPIQEPSSFKKLMMQEDLVKYSPTTVISLEEIKEAKRQADALPIPEKVHDDITKVWAALQNAGIVVTERTFVKSKALLKSHAWLKGKKEVTSDDIEILHNACWKKEAEERKALMTILGVISPDKFRIIQIFHECNDIVNNIKKTKGYKKQVEHAMEANGKIREKRKEVEKLYKNMVDRGQEIDDVKELISKLDRMNSYVVEDILNIQVSA